MKYLLLTGLLLFGVQALKAQELVQLPKGYHQHDGFYVSMSGGLVMGNIRNHTTPYSNYANAINMNGPGQLNDFKIGGSVSKNLILHLTVLSNYLTGPSMHRESSTWDPRVEKAPSSFHISEIMTGVGMTYYRMPANFFFSGSAGIGSFSQRDDEDSDNNAITDPGFSIQLKMGKEWWIGKNWGMGAALSFGKTMVKDNPERGDIQKINSSRIALLFNVTFD